jgi:hypothetical protein
LEQPLTLQIDLVVEVKVVVELKVTAQRIKALLVEAVFSVLAAVVAVVIIPP